jgi:hypothetical protein
MSKYKRNAQAVLAHLHKNATGQVLTKKACKIQVPVRYSEVGLGEIGIKVFTYGLFALILETGEYSVLNVNAILELNPYKISIVTIDEIDYHEFYFDAGQVVITTTNLVQTNTLIYNVMDEFVFKGKMPWYVEYDDAGKMLDTAKYHADSLVGQNPEVIEFIIAMITRSAKDRTTYIRNVAETMEDFKMENISFVPLKSVLYSVNNTVNKIAGSYMTEGIVSALVNPSNGTEQVERILRT